VAIQSNHLIRVMLFFGIMLPAAAQTVAPAAFPAASIDSAMLAKANAGDASAQVAVGEQYAQAAAIEHDKARMAGDYQQELAWYRKAAGQNDIPGEMHLAALYRDGGGKTIPRDMEQAAAWYRKAADQGDPTAQGTLGVLYSMGQGVAHNDVEAYFWLDLAASVKGPNQEKYEANRQMIGQHITTDELSDVEDRVAAWKAAHPRPDSN
jgi:TPR repeat protein